MGAAARTAARARAAADLAVRAAPAGRATRADPRRGDARPRELLPQAGIEGVTPGQLLGASARRWRWSRSCWSSAPRRCRSSPLLFGRFAGAAAARCWCAGGGRSARVELREVWPEAVDNLASGVRAGLSLPEALTPARRARARSSCARRSAASARTTGRPAGSARASTGSRPRSPTRSATGSSRRCGWRARSAAPTSGGCCARCRRSCARTPAPAPSSRPGRAGRSTPPGWRCAAPWVLLLLLSTQPERGRGLQHRRPARSCCSSAAASRLLAYRVMLRHRPAARPSDGCCGERRRSARRSGCWPAAGCCWLAVRDAAGARRPDARRPARALPAGHAAAVPAARRARRR